MSMKNCFLIGRPDAPEGIRPALEEEIERHITEYGVRQFRVGNYGTFDLMARNALIRAKKNHPDIFLLMVIPHHPEIPSATVTSGIDDTRLVMGMESMPVQEAVSRLSYTLVRQADYLIVYSRTMSSGRNAVLQCAEKQAQTGVLQISRLTG